MDLTKILSVWSICGIYGHVSKESQGNTSAEDGKVDSKLMFSEYAVSLEPVAKERYKEKISVIRIDPFLISLQKLQPEC